jgi:uncharacterized protein (DUF58 family)
MGEKRYIALLVKFMDPYVAADINGCYEINERTEMSLRLQKDSLRHYSRPAYMEGDFIARRRKRKEVEHQRRMSGGCGRRMKISVTKVTKHNMDDI